MARSLAALLLKFSVDTDQRLKRLLGRKLTSPLYYKASKMEDIMVGKYKVITLCGSTKFKDEFLKAQKQLTLEVGSGNVQIVQIWLSPLLDLANRAESSGVKIGIENCPMYGFYWNSLLTQLNN